jgi:ABC-type phosphate/phosphonate transport system substrate-binding protein
MRKYRTVLFCYLALSLLVCTPPAVAQDLIFTAPPREKPAAGKALYQPLADHLSKLLGKKVIYVHPGNWLNYQRDMRDDKYDIVFDGPHFASWRMAHLGHSVVARLPGKLEFMLVTLKDDAEINSTNDLIAKKFCGITPPNLSTLSILAAYPNPVRQPVIQGIQGGGMPAVFKAFAKGECRAAVVRNTFYKKKLPETERARLKIIYNSKPLPNQSITLSQRLNSTDARRIRESLTHGDGVTYSHAIVQRFGGKKAKSFITADAQEFTGINTLLEGVIFGW